MLSVVNGAKREWYNIGLGIGVDMDFLDDLESEHSKDHSVCLRKMLQHRVQKGGLTLSILCEGLRGDLVSRSDLADKLEKMFSASGSAEW